MKKLMYLVPLVIALQSSAVCYPDGTSNYYDCIERERQQEEMRKQMEEIRKQQQMQQQRSSW